MDVGGSTDRALLRSDSIPANIQSGLASAETTVRRQVCAPLAVRVCTSAAVEVVLRAEPSWRCASIGVVIILQTVFAAMATSSV